MDNLGAVCGILVCVVFLKILGYRKLFFIAAIPSFIGAAMIFSFVKERRLEDAALYKGFRFSNLNKDFRLFLVLSSIFAIGSFSYSFLLIYAKEYGFRTAFIPVLYLVFTVFASVSSLPFGRLSDRIGRKSVIMLSYALWGLVCLISVLAKGYFAVLLIFVLYGLHKGAFEAAQKAFVSELSPEAFRASCLGSFQMVVGLCALPSSFIAGMLWDKINMLVPFYFSLVLTVVSGVVLVFVRESG